MCEDTGGKVNMRGIEVVQTLEVNLPKQTKQCRREV